jgi:hypothetical protein
MELPCRGQPPQPESQRRIRLTSFRVAQPRAVQQAETRAPCASSGELGSERADKGDSPTSVTERNRLIAEAQKLAFGLDVISSGLKSAKTASCTS